MGVAGDLLLTAVGMALVFAAPLEIAFGALVAFWLLVPGSLVVPYAPHVVLVDALVLDTFAIRLLLRSGLGGEPRGSAYAMGPMHAAVGALVVVGLVDGVILAPRATSLAGDLHGWLYLFHLAVLFVVVLAVTRTIGIWRVVRLVVGVLLVTVAIAIFEWLTGHGWSAFFFKHLPASYLGPGAVGLIKRGSHYRPQVGAQFSLEYAWVLTMFLPLAIYAAIRVARHGGRRARWAVLAPLALIVGVLLAASRGAELGIPVAIVILVVASGIDRRLIKWLGVLAGLAVLVAIVAPSILTKTFTLGSVTDPLSVRFDRLPLLFSQIVHHQLTGVGFNGVTKVFGGLDNAYALIYATIGMIGLVAWVTLFAASGAAGARALRARRETDARVVGAACMAGVIVIFGAAFTYDFQNTVQSPWGLIVLAAVGTAAAETLPRPVRVRRRIGFRLLVPAVGVAFGFGLMALAPTTASETFSVQTVAPWIIAADSGPTSPYQDTTLVHILCSVVTNPDTINPGAQVKCLQASNFQPLADQGVALVTVRAPTPAAVRAEAVRAFTPIYEVMPMEGGLVGTIQTGRPAWANTGPVWCGLVGLVLMFLIPPIRMRRRGGSFEPLASSAPDGVDIDPAELAKAVPTLG